MADVDHDARATALRQAHLSTEASLKSIGSLHYLGAIGLFVAALSVASPARGEVSPALVIGLAVLCASSLAVAYGLRALRPWVRVPAMVLAVVGLFNFPVGTLVGACLLYLTLNAKGRFVLGPQYARIVAATPDVKYRSSALIRVLFVVVILLAIPAVLLFAGG